MKNDNAWIWYVVIGIFIGLWLFNLFATPLSQEIIQ